MAPKLRELVHEFSWGRMDLLAYREGRSAPGLVLEDTHTDVLADARAPSDRLHA
jgi:hypothetical protein